MDPASGVAPANRVEVRARTSYGEITVRRFDPVVTHGPNRDETDTSDQ